MIDYRTVQKIRAKIDIPEETVEKSYLIELLLNYLARDSYFKLRLVFRGGTALKKIYFPDFRYSEDIDFIVKPNNNLAGVADKFERILKRIKKDFPVGLKQRSLFPQKGHLQLFISYEIVPEVRAEKELKINIIEDNFIPPSEKRKLVFSFPDFEKSTGDLRTYDLESIVAEKIGQILDVVDEPRDLWDLHYLLRLKLKVPAIKRTFRNRYGVDIYPPNLISAIKKSSYKNNWEHRLRNQALNLMRYEEIVGELTALIKSKLRR